MQQAQVILAPSYIEGVELQTGRNITAPTPLHFHDEMQISLVEQGGFCYTIGGREYRAQVGNLTVFQSGEAHAAAPIGSQGWSFRSLFISPACLQEIAGGLELPLNSLVTTPAPLEIGEAANSITQVFYSTSALEQQYGLFRLFAGLLPPHPRSTSVQTRRNREDAAIKLMREYIETNYAANIGLEELSQLTNFSKSYLIRTFRKTVGMPPHLFQNQFRILRAKELLSKGITPAQVAYQTGFAHQSHFHRAFRRTFGYTPGYYQKMVTSVQDAS